MSSSQRSQLFPNARSRGHYAHASTQDTTHRCYLGKNGVQRLETLGLMVGAFERANFDEQTLQVEPDDLLGAYSDGVTEARNLGGEEFGEERLVDCVRANCDLVPAELLQSVFSR
jgi:sigma-B regulation protein RsbU (phosphoserine phosphatase)